jgi:hypothetical protein
MFHSPLEGLGTDLKSVMFSLWYVVRVRTGLAWILGCFAISRGKRTYAEHSLHISSRVGKLRRKGSYLPHCERCTQTTRDLAETYEKKVLRTLSDELRLGRIRALEGLPLLPEYEPEPVPEHVPMTPEENAEMLAVLDEFATRGEAYRVPPGDTVTEELPVDPSPERKS